MQISDLNPHIRYARRHSYVNSTPQYSRCYDCRIFFFAKADGRFWIDGDVYNISNNTVIFLPPASRYRFDFQPKDQFELYVLNFDLFYTHAHVAESLRTASDSDFDEAKVPKYHVPDELANPIIRRIDTCGDTMIRCVDEFMTKRNYYRESASAILKSLLIDLLREESAHGCSRLVGDIIDFIKEHYSEPTLTNEEIAQKFGYHPYHLSKRIKEATGMSLKQYLIYYRIQVAKGILISTAASIDEVTWRSGFGSTAYFIKCFRENTGTTPLNYRNKRRQSTV